MIIKTEWKKPYFLVCDSKLDEFGDRLYLTIDNFFTPKFRTMNKIDPPYEFSSREQAYNYIKSRGSSACMGRKLQIIAHYTTIEEVVD